MATIITVYYSDERPLPAELEEKLEERRKDMPVNCYYGIHDRNAHWYYGKEMLNQAKNLSFGLKFACSYRLEDAKRSMRLFKRMINKADGVQKNVPGVIAVQMVQHIEGNEVKERWQWGRIGSSNAHGWCKVDAFSGTATECEETTQAV